MDNNKEKVNFDDDSGEIHTIKEKYEITKEDGWQINHAVNLSNINSVNQPTFVKGKQWGFIYITDDYRKVIPVQIISTLVIIALCIGMLFIYLPMGIFFCILGIVWIIGMWKNAPYKKWKNQSKKIKEEEKKSE